MVKLVEKDNEMYWNAIQMRNKDWDGRIFYGVKSTGIYCRPSCPSRRPSRSSVEYFISTKEAEDAGFRACRRCRPDQIEMEKEGFHRIVSLMEDPVNEIDSVQKWAALVNLSPARLRKTILRFANISPKEYLHKKKMDEFKRRIKTGENVTSSQFFAGFGSSSRLYEKAAASIGMTPGTYKNGGEGMKIVYALIRIPFGELLIAATMQGVCSIQMGDSEDELLNSLKIEFSRAEINPHSGELTPWIDQLNQYFSGSNRNLDIPLELHATTFQLRVWNELRKIPFGETRSYSQVAQAIGKPSAARAVASACAANPVAVVTPCHRVVHSNGSVSGYRWGLDKKKALLLLEKTGKK